MDFDFSLSDDEVVVIQSLSEDDFNSFVSQTVAFVQHHVIASLHHSRACKKNKSGKYYGRKRVKNYFN
ncbi:TPA: hypothetical protein UZ441_002500 [Escherichia coli]|nr:hypothetical protein [Escherichia coli]HEL8023576.1 hypothetical protein [Escherichia coli]HEL8042507.1 hypothetical protein [Escherichia coli]HEL8046849.1 hypothetical protein [Escherichia coli]HEL8051910.1 hypothetical protein [Escherichia coli]